MRAKAKLTTLVRLILGLPRAGIDEASPGAVRNTPSSTEPAAPLFSLGEKRQELVASFRSQQQGEHYEG